MLTHSDTVLEVEGLGKVASRRDSATRRRAARHFFRALMLRPPPKVGRLQDGEFWSLRDVSFNLRRGEALGVMGFNGAGKTTLLRILSGQLLPDEGEVRVLGRTAAMIDLTAGFSASASGRSNIYLRGAMLGRSRAEIEATVREVIEFAELGEAIDAPFSTYSSGMRMRLAFSIMIVSEPDILFIDEILSVGDFRFQQKCLARIREIRERVAFVLVSHSMENIKLFCSSAMVLNEGRVMFSGHPKQAIRVYEDMRFPEASTPEQKRRAILKPQFHNRAGITGVEHYWCDSEGNPISEVRSGEELLLRVRFCIAHRPREFVMGVPVWSEKGEYLTGFSTELSDKRFHIKEGLESEFILRIPNLPFNPGRYVSNLSISDGPEFLYRGANPELVVTPCRNRFWGAVTLDHSWTQVAANKGEDQSAAR